VHTREFVQQQLQEFFYYLRSNKFLMHPPLMGFPDGYWDIKELDLETLEPIPPKEIPPWDLTKEVPADILKELEPRLEKTKEADQDYGKTKK